MNVFCLLLAGACMAMPALASAGAIYTWSASAYSADIHAMRGYIELSEAATGHLSYRARSCPDWPCDLADPGSAILRFVMEVNHLPQGALDIDPVRGSGYDIGQPLFDAEFDIVGARITRLQLRINTFVSTLFITDGVVERYSSDTDNCFSGCSGASGEFVREAAAPEPGTLALLALGGVGVLAALRRRIGFPDETKSRSQE